MPQAPIERLSVENIRRLSKKSSATWLKDAVQDWIIIAAVFTVLAATKNLWMLLLAILIIGNRQHALTVLGHEGAHFTLSKKRWVNDNISNFFSFWALGLTTTGYRNVHMKHHKHTNTQHDPELAHRGARAPQWNLPIKMERIIRYCVQDMLGYSLSDYIIIVTFSKPDSRKEYWPMAVMHLAFLTVTLAAGFWWVPMIWYVSLVTSFMMFFRLRTFLEHLGTAETHRLHLTWWQKHILAPHNIWYHWEHHNYPTIAYQNLPKVRKLLPQVPEMSLSELLAFLANTPQTSSGQVLKQDSMGEEVYV